jgi:L-lactate dehydrogenase complex protein LldE
MKVSLFVTCLVDQMYPEVGVGMLNLLKRLGVEVSFNPEQTCCGQPLFNSGYHEETLKAATHMLEVFEHELKSSDYLVAPSGSCTTMVKKYYQELFLDQSEMLARAQKVGARLFELTQFLTEVLEVEDVGASFGGRVTYHDSCHLLRELGVSQGPRRLIESVRGVEFVEMDQSDACCGFGGTFSVKYPEISVAITDEKILNLERSGADVLVACDSSCLMQIAGRLNRRGSNIRCLHIAELLTMNEPARDDE